MKKSLVKILQSQGFGSRKECTWIIEKSGVSIGDHIHHDPKAEFETEELKFEVAAQKWSYRRHVYLALNKKIGYECSANPQHHPSVLDELPDQFINRGIKIAGRLDVDTSGLLLLSDDGQFIHHVTSPKRGITKTYQIGLKHPFDEVQKEKLINGVQLNGEEGRFQASDLVERSEHRIEFDIQGGCYHQVKRMIAAISNRVESLERIRVGALSLEDGPELGCWKYLHSEQLEHLGYEPKS